MREEDEKKTSKERIEEVKKEVEREVERENIEQEAKKRQIEEDGRVVDDALIVSQEYVSKKRNISESDIEKIQRARLLAFKRIEEVRQKKVIPKSEQGKFIFEKIIETKIDEYLLANPYASLRIYELLEKALLKESLTLDDLRLSFEKVKQGPVDYDFIEKWREILINTAVKMGNKREDVEKYFYISEDEKEFFHESQTTQALIRRLSKEQADFFNALLSIDKFSKYIRDLRIKIEQEIDSSITGEKRKKELAIKLSKYINDQISGIIFNIYQAASHHPNEQFSNIERHGPFMETPADFYLAFSQRFERLNSQISELKDGLGLDLEIGILQKKEVKGIKDDNGQELPPYFRYTGEYELINIGYKHGLREFLERIHQYAQSEKRRLEAGHNLRYLIKAGAHNEEVKKDGFFKTMSRFLAHIETTDIDEIFFDPEVSDLIQQALGFFEMTLEREMMENNWIKRPDLATRYFDSLHRYEKEMIEYLRKRRPDLPDWQILRIIANTNLMFLGANYQLMHYFSFADPDRAAFGESLTITDAGDLMLSPYDPGMLQRRFQDVNLTGQGADWMPINVVIEDFDHELSEKFKEAYNNSLTQGRAAYFWLLPKEWKYVRLGVDPGNISKAGGFTTLQASSWRLWNAYKYWLGEENLDFATEKFKSPGSKDTAYIEAWKRLENLGIDILENFFIYKGNGVAGGNLKELEGKKNVFKFGERRKENLLNLFGYFYDRYFDQSIAGVRMADVFFSWNGKTLNREQFLKYIESNIDPSVYTYTDIDRFLKERFYDVFTVMILERTPTKILTLEKQRLTQNGIRLYDELREKYFISEYSRIYGSSSYNNIREAYITSIDDLSYVESTLRIEANAKMRELKERNGNLYGNLSSLRSDVEYWLTEEKIERILGDHLRKTGLSAEEIKKRIQLAKITYKGIIQRASMIPEKAKWELELETKREEIRKLKRKLFKTKKEKDKIRAFEGFLNKDPRSEFTSRIKWFSKMLVDDDFGFSFTSGDVAYHFLNFSANGPSLLSRLAAFNFDTAEIQSQAWIMNDAWAKDMANYNLAESYKIMDKVYLSARNQWGTGYQASRSVAAFLRRTFTYFRKDEGMYGEFNKTWNRLFGKNPERSSSFAQEHGGGPRVGSVYEWGLNEMDQIIHETIGGRGVKYFDYRTPEKEKLYKYEDFEDKHKFLGKVLNKFFVDKEPPKLIKKMFGVIKKDGRFYKRVRDYAQEVSGEAIKKTQKYRGGFFRKEILPRVLILLLIISLILAFKSAKDDFEVGKGKK